ncbi:DUF1275 family protein [Acrocarpospora catenulata]|uniref:DUF1275 family protein n=1 Tax=Acrocarpospora catenulata TaxID=2836182 RepID=UPI001BD9C6BD|nr:YoaK family protein [Acrocarpospora catenulata]
MGSRPPARRSVLRPVNGHRLHLWLMMALTFSTGMVDAVGFLGLDRVFTGNMTGNVVVLGMAAAGADDFPVLGPALALAGFLAGAAYGGRVLRPAPPGWSGRVGACLGTVAAISLVLGVVITAVEMAAGTAAEDVPAPLAVATTTLLGAVMGLQAGSARHIAVAEVTTVVVTSTLTALASQSRIAGGTGDRNGRRAVAVALLLGGAAAGAVLLRIGVGAGLLVAGAIMAAVTAVGVAHARAVASDMASDMASDATSANPSLTGPAT